MMARKNNFYPAVLATAVAAALYIPQALSTTQTDGAYNISTSSVKKSGDQRAMQLSEFTSKLLDVMNSQGSFAYLSNKHLADSSTFPFRLLSKQKELSWQSAPSHGITVKDLNCYYGVPSYKTPQEFDPDTTPIVVESDKVSGDLENHNDDLIYSGNVILSQQDNVITTDKLQYSGKEKTFYLNGNTVVNTPEYTLSTKKPIKSDLKNQTLYLSDANIQLNGSYIRGNAASQEINRKEKSQVLKDASLTSCPIDDSSWHFNAVRCY